MRSVNNIVILPASTGRDNNKRKAVSKAAQANMGMISRERATDRMLTMVVMKFSEPRIEEIPARCSEKIAKSTALPLCPNVERGGYTVQPVPTPDSRREENKSKKRAGGRSQKEKLLRRGNAMSGAPMKRGTNQFPKPPIIVGITKKKIITKA